MKRALVLALFLSACICGLHAQAGDTTVCAVLKNPASFDGKMVTIKGAIVAGFDEFAIADGDCGLPVNAIWISYPQGTKAKGGPFGMLELQPAHNFAGTYTAPTRTPVTLDRGKDFKQFDSLLSQTHVKEPGVCLGCGKFKVTATLTGRLDAVADATLRRDPSGKVVFLGGFGNLNAYPARLVLQSVTGVSSKPIDFSKSDLVVKGEPVSYSNTFDAHDPGGVARQFASVMGTDAVAVAIQKDAGVYSKSGNVDGVIISVQTINEADQPAETGDSPDGVLYVCTFTSNIDRLLLKPAQAAAMIHIGQHIIDLRAETGDKYYTIYDLENIAWIITAASTARMGEQFLTLSGGYLFLSATWAPADRSSMMSDALSTYLTKEAAYGR